MSEGELLLGIASVFERVAQKLDAEGCQLCGAQDEHEVCEQPDLPRALREVAIGLRDFGCNGVFC